MLEQILEFLEHAGVAISLCAVAVIVRRQLKRRQLLPFFRKLPACVIAGPLAASERLEPTIIAFLFELARQPFKASLAGTYALPSASATALCVTWPSWMLRPSRKYGSDVSAWA